MGVFSHAFHIVAGLLRIILGKSITASKAEQHVIKSDFIVVFFYGAAQQAVNTTLMTYSRIKLLWQMYWQTLDDQPVLNRNTPRQVESSLLQSIFMFFRWVATSSCCCKYYSCKGGSEVM